MATTSIWKIEGRIDKVLGYVDNPEKTTSVGMSGDRPKYSEVDLMALRDVVDYATDGGKTDQQHFVSGINCDIATARAQMVQTKKQWMKEDGIIAFHGYQSFAPGEVTAELAHKIGIELAEKLWGDRFEVVVATHLNTKCYHNHFVVNSVSFVDGKRFYRNNASNRKMRRESDELCRQYSLSVVEQKQGSYPRTITEWQAEQHGQDTWKTPLRNDIDQAIAQSNTFQAFVRNLKAKGYNLRYGDNIKHMSVRPPWYGRSVRIHRLGEEYSEAAIKKRISERPRSMAQRNQNQTPKKKIKQVRVKGFRLTRITWKGLRAQYYYYLARIKKAQRRPQTASFVLRNDIRYMETISKQAAFMAKYGLETLEQIHTFIHKIDKNIGKLQADRRQLRNEMRRVGNAGRKEEFQNWLTAITEQLKPLHEQKKMCANILLRSEKIRESISRLKEEDLKQKEERERESRTRRSRTDR